MVAKPRLQRRVDVRTEDRRVTNIDVTTMGTRDWRLGTEGLATLVVSSRTGDRIRIIRIICIASSSMSVRMRSQEGVRVPISVYFVLTYAGQNFQDAAILLIQ